MAEADLHRRMGLQLTHVKNKILICKPIFVLDIGLVGQFLVLMTTYVNLPRHDGNELRMMPRYVATHINEY